MENDADIEALLANAAAREAIARFLALIARGDRWPNLAQGCARQYGLVITGK
jgi:hypothetical protein